MASIHKKSCISSFQDGLNFSWHMGQGASARIGSLGAGMNLFFGSFSAAMAASRASEASKSLSDPELSFSLLSLDLIHACLTLACGKVLLFLFTYHLIHVPTPTLNGSGGVCERPICVEMPVHVSGFLCSTLLRCKETTTTYRTLVWLSFVN